MLSKYKDFESLHQQFRAMVEKGQVRSRKQFYEYLAEQTPDHKMPFSLHTLHTHFHRLDLQASLPECSDNDPVELVHAIPQLACRSRRSVAVAAPAAEHGSGALEADLAGIHFKIRDETALHLFVQAFRMMGGSARG